MYATNIDGQELTLHVSGKLWNRSLVMRDLQTGSLWSHILGQCMQGSLCGTQLPILPSQLTSWSDWTSQHPNTSVMMLPPTRTRYTVGFYEHDELFGYGLLVGERAKIYSFAGLAQQPLLNDEFENESLVIIYNPESRSAMCWDRELPLFGTAGETRLLTFESRDGKFMDVESGSVWDLSTGKCTSGALAGSRLEYQPLVISAQRAWRTFHPTTVIWPYPDLYDASLEPEDGGVAVE